MRPEFAAEIFAARGRKTIIAVADTMICSCAYWLASQVDTIYATQSAEIGAIGVYAAHEDLSGMLEQAGITVTLIAHGDNKIDGNPYEKLSATARAQMQAGVDEIGGWFEAAVARGRGVTTSVVLKSFGQGLVFRGQEAIARTFDAVLTQYTSPRSQFSRPALALPASSSGLAGPQARALMRAEQIVADEQAILAVLSAADWLNARND